MRVLLDLTILIESLEQNQAGKTASTDVEFLLARSQVYIPSFQLLKIDSKFEKLSENYLAFVDLLKHFKIAKTPSYINLEESANYSSIENYLFSITAKSIGAQFILTRSETLINDSQLAISLESFLQDETLGEAKKEATIPFLSLQQLNNTYEPQLEKAFDEVINSGWYLLGKQLQMFESEYAQFNSVKYCIGVSNGLDALHLSLLALGIGVGDEVIVPSNTYIATVLAISYVGATPIFVEPNIRTYNIDPLKVEEKISRKTKAIMPVHLYGQACEMGAIMHLAEKFSLYVVEDNAQSQGAMYNGRQTGSFGKVNGTSFYPGKNLGALGDAGAVTTDDLVLANRISTLRNYGSSKKYFNEVIGHNMRLDELQAAFLGVKLKDLFSTNSQRQTIANKYNNLLTGIGDLILPEVAEGASHVYHLYVIRTELRDSLQQYLSNNGISTLIHYPIPPHLQQAYEFLSFKKGDYPIAERLAETCLSLPIWPGMTDVQVSFVCNNIKRFFAHD